jgi:hypothetical protein
MRILFLFLLLQANAFSQSLFANLKPSCSIGFSSSLYKIFLYNSSGYSFQGDALSIIQCDSVIRFETDSSKHISTALSCIESSNAKSNYYQNFELNLICFYSKKHYSKIHQQRIDLLSEICIRKNYSLLLILQEYPKELLSEMPVILE